MEPLSDTERIAALQARNAELELELQQVEETLRKQAEITTEKALSLLRTTLEATADGILAINAQGSVTHFNRNLVELWQVPESIITWQADWQLLPFLQEQLRDSEAFLSQVKAEYAQLDLESHSFLEFKDGRVFERYSKPQVLGEDIIGRVITYRDITSLKEVEAALRQSEERFSKAFRANPISSAISTLSEGRILDINDSFLNLVGYSREEVIGRNLSELNLYADESDREAASPWEPRDRVRQLLQQQQGIRDFEFRYRTKSGEIRDGIASFEVVNLGGELCLLNQVCDVTDRKRVETELQQSQRLLQEIIDAAPMRIYLKDLQGRYLIYNRHCESLTGLCWKQVIGKTDRELFGLQIANQFQSNDHAALEAGQAITIERNLQEADGIHTYLTIKFPVFDADGNPYGVCGISTDISDRKRIEEELHQSEERFSKAFRSNPAATTITTIADGRYIDVNDSFLTLLGFNREEVIGKTSVGLGLWVRERSQVMRHYIQQLQHEPIHELEIQFRNKSGEIRDGITSAVLIDLSGELCMLAQLYDVTDRKRAEAALKYRLDFEALLTNISTQFINLKATEVDQAINQALQEIGEFAQVDRACIFLISNERFFNTHQWFADGIPPLVYPQQGLALETIPDTVEQLRQFKTIHTPRVADLPEPRKSLSESFEVKSYIAVPIAYEGCLIGSLAFNSIRTSKTWSDEDAALLRALANIFANALMRKHSEEVLRESEERFRQLAENIDSVFWMFSVDEQRTQYISPAYEKIWGRSSQRLYESHQDWIDSIHPDDYEEAINLLECQVRGETAEGIYRIIRPDGEIRWICDRSFPIYDSYGKLYRVAGISDDITDRKLAENALLESEAKLNAILDSAIAVIIRFQVFANLDWEFEFISSGAEILYGYTPQELMADRNLWISRVLPEDLENVIVPSYENIFVERTAQLEYRLRHKDGSLRWFSMTMFPQRDETTDSWVVTSVETDISDRKLVEEQLEASLREKEVLLKEVHHRVKNNLQVVSSLLDLQSQRIQEPQVLEMFQNSQSRVRSMALIHEKLYQSKSLSRVNFADYIESLAMHLIQNYAVDPDRISLQLNLEPILLNLDTAIPCGLILNELVSNALKHGFPGNTGGTIWIGLCSVGTSVSCDGGDDFELVIGNNGVKLPELPDFSRAKSLGLQLVRVLIQQLEGQIEVSQSQGTEFKLRFRELEHLIT
ncbi:PAS domain S-box protein [Microcoleus sp. FACHB-SPT15]|uniref:PAS domain S-box protein n=1 Tax=Microcoleus sp. FACHB-SPT15 TaxID=2692830 RepID=UPI00177C1894|nr:PAS domain S-box protein [Microcoleus sp. FACHB-SPT15]MBD1807576.1 PAS domain S-box protein [Microcoleus sp. FACHB-SPT15]